MKLLQAIFSALFLVAMCSHYTSAESGIFGVSPSNIQFSNVIRGGYAERPIVISYNQDETVKVQLSAEGEIADWFNFTKNVTVSKSKFAREVVSVSPPSDIPNGNYSGLIVFSVSREDNSGKDGNAVSTLISVLQMAVTVEVTDRENFACTANNFVINSAEKGDDVSFSIDVLNEGNIRIKPEVKLNLYNQDQSAIVKELTFTGKEMLPTKEQSLNFTFDTSDLDTSQYWAYAEIPACYFSDTQPFDVLEPGALKSNLVLVRMYNSPFGAVGDTLPVVIDYENTGEKDVSAQFKGQITLNGKVVQVLESDPFTSPAGESSNITLYFTPQKAGKYVAAGRIFYDKKRTFESSSVINIITNGSNLKTFLTIGLYAIILVVIVGLLVAIRRERRQYADRINMLKMR